jgi:hypothetical protein
MVGPALTVNGPLASEGQPVLVCVNVNVAVPGATPVANPELLIVAIKGALDTQAPPVVGA